jgi:hypothetical protein
MNKVLGLFSSVDVLPAVPLPATVYPLDAPIEVMISNRILDWSNAEEKVISQRTYLQTIFEFDCYRRQLHKH